MPRVLSVDLAAQRYADNGIALLDGHPGAVACRIVHAAELGLTERPEPEPFAEALHRLAEVEGVGLMLLDGPQGWRADVSELVHQRRCERETRTPGKTGPPLVVKPATWTRMAVFCVALFDGLAARGWPRITSAWAGERASIESFPTQAWRSLGHPPLPAKAKTESLAPWIARLETLGVHGMPASVSHDELQAVVAGLAGIQLLTGGFAAADPRGCDPTLEGQYWREGWIISPSM